MASRQVEHITYGGREVRLTNLAKVLFPDDGITKGDVIQHVVDCQEPLLRALQRRPLTMERRVDGLRSDGFFHKHAPEHFPDWIPTVEIPTSRGPMKMVVVDELAALVVVTNFGCLTPHVPTTTIDRPFHPDMLVFDLDPSPGSDLARIREAALLTRGLLEELGLAAFPRWSGSRGVHVLVPLDGTADAEVVGRFALAVAEELVRRHPKLFTLEFTKAARGDRIYLDIARNHPGATCVASFAIRPLPGAPLAMPITWEELETTGPRSFTIRDGPARAATDPWAGFEDARVGLRA